MRPYAVPPVLRRSADHAQRINRNAACCSAGMRFLSLLVVYTLTLFAVRAAAADVAATCPIRPGSLCVEADLQGARLAGADLRMADFSRSNLVAADLSGANLRNADMDFTNLARADLSEAILVSADLTGADLRR